MFTINDFLPVSMIEMINLSIWNLEQVAQLRTRISDSYGDEPNISDFLLTSIPKFLTDEFEFHFLHT